VGFPDWELYRKIESLFIENATGSNRTFEIRGSDRRGTFTAGDLASFRSEAEVREDELDELSIDVRSEEADASRRRFFVLLTPERILLARVTSGDEIIATGVAERLRDLVLAANRRLERREEPAKPFQSAISALRDAFRHPIISGLIVGLILFAFGVWLRVR